MSTGAGITTDLDQEQAYVSMLYRRLDELRAAALRRLAEVRLAPTGGTMQERSERDSAATRYADQATELGAVESGLCFGRLDLTDGSRRYIGRIGIFDQDDEYEPLLMDWRAPAARPFYLATAAAPDGVTRRRHIRTRGRTVVALDDEVLDLTLARGTKHEGLVGEAALLAALGAARTGRMRDIVETIQAEQDQIIRSDLNGVLVVQGGPGTGKTAVALHRAAYLLYTYRRELSTRGVLIVGPNETFLKYISQVLPSLAETGVLLRTVGDLYPGLSARRTEPAAVAEIKGRLEMADVLATAVKDRQIVPDEPLTVLAGGEPLVLDRDTIERARASARRSDQPHNLARAVFETEIVYALSLQLGDRIGADLLAEPEFADIRKALRDDPLAEDNVDGNVLDEADMAEMRRDLRKDPDVRAVIDQLWPVLTPRQLVAELFESPERLASAAAQLSTEDRMALLRTGSGWTPADVPLLDEADELLGERESGLSLEELRRRAEIGYAAGALAIAEGSRSTDFDEEAIRRDREVVEPEILAVSDVIDAARLAERYAAGERLTAAERAALDRAWAFGHVIVDEAQELSPMAWRLLMRRSPSRSMTLVGDLAQTGDLGGASSWGDALKPYVADRWRLAELTVSYRTPAEIMAYAAAVLPEVKPPRAVRSVGYVPWELALPKEDWAGRIAMEASELDDGRLGVIAPPAMVASLAQALSRVLPDVAVGDQPDLTSRVVVLTVRQAKGLEFDSVVVVDPDGIRAGSPRGSNDLYVALTRATQRLGVLRPA